MKALPEPLQEQFNFLKSLATDKAQYKDRLGLLFDWLEALPDTGEAVAEIYRMHFGGRTRNIGTNDVRALIDVNTLPVGTRLYLPPPTQSAQQIPAGPQVQFEDNFLVGWDEPIADGFYTLMPTEARPPQQGQTE